MSSTKEIAATDEEIFTTKGVNDDYDQINQDKLTQNKYGSTQNFGILTSHINYEAAQHGESKKVFEQASRANVASRFTLQKSRQA